MSGADDIRSIQDAQQSRWPEIAELRSPEICRALRYPPDTLAPAPRRLLLVMSNSQRTESRRLTTHRDTTHQSHRRAGSGVPFRAAPTRPAMPLIVLANRAPFRRERLADGSVSVVRSSGGLVTAIEPLIQAQSGTWVAHGEEPDFAAADAFGRVAVRSGRSRYHVRYVQCEAAEYEGFYCGFANEALWPLCHAAHVQPTFRAGDFRHYEAANRCFAAAVCEEGAGLAPIVFVQDYHFALAPTMIRRGLPRARSCPSGIFHGRTSACSGCAPGRLHCSKACLEVTSSACRPTRTAATFSTRRQHSSRATSIRHRQ